MNTLEKDPRAKWKHQIRQWPRLASWVQFLLDPAYTPRHEIKTWVKHQRQNTARHLLNVGGGSRDYGERVINLDAHSMPSVHVESLVNFLPFQSQSMGGVLMEYVLEHVWDGRTLLRDVHRILEPGGELLMTVPWQQTYHACPQDYFRWSFEGLQRELTELGFEVLELKAYGGPVSAWINLTKELLALIASGGHPILFGIFSQVFLLPFIPLRYLDGLLRHFPAAHFLSFSYICRARKGQKQQNSLNLSVPWKRLLACQCGTMTSEGKNSVCSQCFTSFQFLKERDAVKVSYSGGGIENEST